MPGAMLPNGGSMAINGISGSDRYKREAEQAEPELRE